MERHRSGARLKLSEGQSIVCSAGLKQICDNPRFRLPCQAPPAKSQIVVQNRRLARAPCTIPCLTGQVPLACKKEQGCPWSTLKQ